MFFAKPLQRSNLCASHRQRRWLTHGELDRAVPWQWNGSAMQWQCWDRGRGMSVDGDARLQLLEPVEDEGFPRRRTAPALLTNCSSTS